MSSFFLQVEHEGGRVLLWPIRIMWGSPMSSKWFGVHGWEAKPDVVDVELTSLGMMPGYRQTWGWTYHIGRLKIVFGRSGRRRKETSS
jgi:hypothetical protein